MRQRVYARGYILLSILLLVFAASAAMAQPMATLHLRITDTGIVGQPTGQLDGGIYVVTIRNDTKGDRGLVMTGIDRAVSPYIRFTKVLHPGQELAFRWYFPKDRQVNIRDLIRCGHAERTCMAAAVGGMRTTLDFAA